MSELSRQDVQNIVDNARKAIMDRAVKRQDVRAITENARCKTVGCVQDLMQAQQQTLVQRISADNAQTAHKIASLEARLVAIEHQLQQVTHMLSQVSEQLVTPKKRTLPGFPRGIGRPSPEQHYTYRPQQ